MKRRRSIADVPIFAEDKKRENGLSRRSSANSVYFLLRIIESVKRTTVDHYISFCHDQTPYTTAAWIPDGLLLLHTATIDFDCTSNKNVAPLVNYKNIAGTPQDKLLISWKRNPTDRQRASAIILYSYLSSQILRMPLKKGSVFLGARSLASQRLRTFFLAPL